MDRDVLLLASRVCLAAVFLYSGLDKLVNWPGAVAEAQGLGLPLPAFAMAATVAVQLTGGLAVLLGAFARIGAALLLVFTVAATLLAHWPFGLTGDKLRQQLTTSLEHLAIVGGFVAIIAVGAGSASLDAVRRQQAPGNAPVQTPTS